jgi:phosphoserine phosphatase RsbX
VDELSIIEWGWAGEALGEPAAGRDSGDLHVVAPFPGGALVAVIDGLGHGPEAASARTAARVLEVQPGDPVRALVERCHEGLRKTRGAVMSPASFDAQTSSITLVGVGNVEGVLLRSGPAGRRPVTSPWRVASAGARHSRCSCRPPPSQRR